MTPVVRRTVKGVFALSTLFAGCLAVALYPGVIVLALLVLLAYVIGDGWERREELFRAPTYPPPPPPKVRD